MRVIVKIFRITSFFVIQSSSDFIYFQFEFPPALKLNVELENDRGFKYARITRV